MGWGCVCVREEGEGEEETGLCGCCPHQCPRSGQDGPSRRGRAAVFPLCTPLPSPRREPSAPAARAALAEEHAFRALGGKAGGGERHTGTCTCGECACVRVHTHASTMDPGTRSICGCIP